MTVQVDSAPGTCGVFELHSCDRLLWKRGDLFPAAVASECESNQSQDSFKCRIVTLCIFSNFKCFFGRFLVLKHVLAPWNGAVGDGAGGHLVLVPLAAGGGENHKVPQKKGCTKSSTGKLRKILQMAQLCICTYGRTRWF